MKRNELNKKGLKKVCGATKNCHPWGYGCKIQINYLPEKGFWCDYHGDGNSIDVYHDKNVRSIFTRVPMSMAKIADAMSVQIGDIADEFAATEKEYYAAMQKEAARLDREEWERRKHELDWVID